MRWQARALCAKRRLPDSGSLTGPVWCHVTVARCERCPKAKSPQWSNERTTQSSQCALSDAASNSRGPRLVMRILVRAVEHRFTRNVPLAHRLSMSVCSFMFLCACMSVVEKCVRCDVLYDGSFSRVHCVQAYMDSRFALRETLGSRLAGLPPDQFEGMLHAVFQQDEWMVLLLGGILGIAVGSFQFCAFHYL